MLIMTKFSALDVVLVPFPFADLSTKKKRPALILKGVKGKAIGNLVVCAMMTSNIHGELIEGDVVLEAWEQAGLIHPTKLRLAKIVTLEERMVLKKMGQMTSRDIKTVRQVFQKMFGF